MRKSVLFFLFATLFQNAAFSLNSNHFTINRITAPYFIVDGNAPATVTRCYVGFEVINNSNSATTYQNLVFTVLNIGTSVTGQNYSILAPLSKSINIGTLSPGQSKVCYFYVNYPANTSAIASFNTELTDGTPLKKNNTFPIYNRSSISANAGGISVNSFNNQDQLGGILTDTVTYTVGNVRNGDEADFQVASTSSFDPTKLDLISTQIIQSSVPGIRVGTTDSLYFITGNGGVGATIRVLWKFRIVGYNFTTYLLPLAGATSGATNYKYALNSGIGVGTPITVSASANALTIQKFSDADLYCSSINNTARFTVRIRNNGLFDVSLSSIHDTLPNGFIFNGIATTSQVTDENSIIIPNSGTSGAIAFEGGVTNGGNSSYVIPAGGQLELVYDATVPSGSIGLLTSGATASVGTTSIGYIVDTLTLSCSLPIKLLSFDAISTKGDISLNWSTSAEVNSKKFKIRHSIDGVNWSILGEVQASGNSQSIKKYNFIHLQPTNDLHFYQLEEVSFDQSNQLSRIVKVSLDSKTEMSVYPTIVTTNQINVTVQKATTIMIFDINGKLVKTKQILPGQNRIELQGMSKGIYFIKSNFGETKKFVLN